MPPGTAHSPPKTVVGLPSSSGGDLQCPTSLMGGQVRGAVPASGRPSRLDLRPALRPVTASPAGRCRIRLAANPVGGASAFVFIDSAPVTARSVGRGEMRLPIDEPADGYGPVVHDVSPSRMRPAADSSRSSRRGLPRGGQSRAEPRRHRPERRDYRRGPRRTEFGVVHGCAVVVGGLSPATTRSAASEMRSLLRLTCAATSATANPRSALRNRLPATPHERHVCAPNAVRVHDLVSCSASRGGFAPCW